MYACCGVDTRWEGQAEDGTGPPDLLSALGEERLTHLGKGHQGQICGVFARTGEHHAVDFGAWPEALGAKCGDQSEVHRGAGDDADGPILVRIGRGQQSLAYFFLHGDGHTHAVRVLGHQNEHERGARAVGQIGNKPERFMRECIDEGGCEGSFGGEAVAFEKREVGAITEEVPEQGAQVGVQFAGDDTASSVEQFFGHGAGARADFEDEIAFARARGIDELAEEVVVDEKVLPKRAAGAQPAFVEHGANPGEGLHDLPHSVEDLIDGVRDTIVDVMAGGDIGGGQGFGGGVSHGDAEG